MKLFKKTGTSSAAPTETPRFPGILTATDGSSAVVHAETLGSEAAGAYPITPSTQMGEGWAAAVGAGASNVFGRRLLFFEPEGEHAAAAVTTGMSLTGLRAANFSSGQGIAYMHESLYPAVGKRLTYVLNMACRAMTKSTLNVHAGHDDYHAVDDTGFFQIFAKNVQEAGDFTLIAHRLAELSLNPGISAQDGFLTSHVIENARLVEPELVREYLGDPSDKIGSVTPAQRLVFGETRRRIPEMFDVDYPAMIGVVQNQDSYAQSVAAQRPFYFDHVEELCDRAMDEFAALTGRRYARVAGYRMEDAEYVLMGQGSVVELAECVADHLREAGLKVGVVNLTMFRPFPADLVAGMLAGKKAVTVLERLDQPLAVDPPILREVRAALGKAVENQRAEGDAPHAGVPAVAPGDVPDFYSACFGMGSRDLQPRHLIAVVENMRASGRRHAYLGIEFLRKQGVSPKMEIWQQELAAAYPHLADLALEPGDPVNLIPAGHTSIRIHSIGGWGAITMGKNLGITASDLLGLHIKANPKYGSEKAGQPTTFYATLAPEQIKPGGELLEVDVVLSQDPNVFKHTNPLAGIQPGGVFVIQSTASPEELWQSLPRTAQAEIREKGVELYALDGFLIAAEESSNDDLRYRMQGAAFLGAFFHGSHLMRENDLTEERLFEGLLKQLTKKFGRLGQAVVDDNMRVIRRGYDEVRRVHWEDLPDEGQEPQASPEMPVRMRAGAKVAQGIGDGARFWEQVGHLYKTAQDPLADPFVAMSAIPAATSAMRDMTHVRFEVPEFLAENCTGCSQCWTQCPDSAIPGMVHTVDELLDAAMATAKSGKPLARFKQVKKHVAKETHRVLQAGKVPFPEALDQAYEAVKDKLGMAPEKRAETDAEFSRVATALADFPVAKTGPFFDAPERRAKGSGGLLSVTVNPETCKGCMECVEVCPDGALRMVPQTEDVVDELERNWDLWLNLPETDDHFVNIASLEDGIGTLSSMMIQRKVYESMLGGDGACMGCGEKTNIHLILAALNALMAPRVKGHLDELRQLVVDLEARGRALVAGDVDLAAAAAGGDGALNLDAGGQAHLRRIQAMTEGVQDLIWRYEEGPSGRGRANLGMANSTGCTSVWASTYPYNPYPFPWVNHLFQDAPSIAIGLFEGHMRKMADGFRVVRRAKAELAGSYDPDVTEAELARLDWHGFTDDEFHLCPPIFALGGDGAMLDIGFQNLSRLMASGKPIKVVVLDTQVYSNTGGQACTSGYTGQVSDMATYGDGNHGKTEVRKELGLIAMAHRGVFVCQSSQALPSHMLKGAIRGLSSRRPAIFVLHSPCMPEHVIEASAAARQAKLALDARAYPLLIFDPDKGQDMGACLELDGNPSQTETWSRYKLDHVDDEGNARSIELPMTIADWAATEGRFQKHFSRLADDAEAVHYADYLALTREQQEGVTPFIYTLGKDMRLGRLAVSPELCKLGRERIEFWNELRELAGSRPGENARYEIETALEARLEAQFQARVAALQAEYEGKLSALRASYPVEIARSIAEGLLAADAGDRTISEILAEAPLDLASVEPAPPADPAAAAAPAPAPAPATVPALEAEAPAAEPAVEAPPEACPEPAAAAPEGDDEELAMEPYIDTEECTSCNECISVNDKLFAYDGDGLAEIVDPKAGPFSDLVKAAENCPVAIIHPGTPLDKKERDLDDWIKRAEPFN